MKDVSHHRQPKGRPSRKEGEKIEHEGDQAHVVGGFDEPGGFILGLKTGFAAVAGFFSSPSVRSGAATTLLF